MLGIIGRALRRQGADMTPRAARLAIVVGMVIAVAGSITATATAFGAQDTTREADSTPKAIAAEDANPTTVALQQDKLRQEIRQLETANDRGFFGWLWSNGASLAAAIVSAIVAVTIARVGVTQFFATQRNEADNRLQDRQDERRRLEQEATKHRQDHAEERFRSVVSGLSDDADEAKVSAAVTLRAFLRPGYEAFYLQVFDLAAVHLRLMAEPDRPNPRLSLVRAMAQVLAGAYPEARDWIRREGRQDFLDASEVTLQGTHLVRADFAGIWMANSRLAKVDLTEAMLMGANLQGADLTEATLTEAIITGQAKLVNARLIGARLTYADLTGADLTGANLSLASMLFTKLDGANLVGALLTGADLTLSSLAGANLTGANPEDALSLLGADMRGVDGLSAAQRAACEAKDARFA